MTARRRRCRRRGGGAYADARGATSNLGRRAVQITCTYTFTRVFLRYSYESAMVVVYSQTYQFTDGVAGMIAGGSAFLR